MSSVLSALYDDPATNVINFGIPNGALLAMTGAATFAQGSEVKSRATLNLNRPIFIANINNDVRPQAEATTPDQLVAAKTAAKVNLATSSGTAPAC